MNGYKYLIVSGDSFTIGHHLHEAGSWATYLGEKFGLQVINVARGGAGNEYISNTLLMFLLNNPNIWNESIVMAAWSEVGRQLTYYKDFFGSDASRLSKFLSGHAHMETIHPGDFFRVSNNGESSLQHWAYDNRDVLFPILGNIEWCVYQTYKHILSIKNFTNANNIKFFHFDMIHPNKCVFPTDTEHKTILVPTIDPNIFDEIIQHPPVLNRVTAAFIGHDHPIPHTTDWKEFWTTITPKTTEYIFNNLEYIDDIFGFKTPCHWVGDALDGHDLYQKGNDGHLNVLGSQKLAESLEKSIHERL